MGQARAASATYRERMNQPLLDSAEGDRAKLVTANEQFYLLRDGVKTCWPPADAEPFLEAAIKLWDKW